MAAPSPSWDQPDGTGGYGVIACDNPIHPRSSPGDVVEAPGALALAGSLWARCAISHGRGMDYLAGFVVVDTTWLLLSRLSFASDNTDSIIHLALYTAIAFGFCGLVSHRLAKETDRVGTALRESVKRVELFAVATLSLHFSQRSSSHIAASAPPHHFPCRMPGLRRSTDGWASTGSPFWSSSTRARWQAGCGEGLSKTPYVLMGTIMWFCVSGQGGRLAGVPGVAVPYLHRHCSGR